MNYWPSHQEADPGTTPNEASNPPETVMPYGTKVRLLPPMLATFTAWGGTDQRTVPDLLAGLAAHCGCQASWQVMA